VSRLGEIRSSRRHYGGARGIGLVPTRRGAIAYRGRDARVRSADGVYPKHKTCCDQYHYPPR